MANKITKANGHIVQSDWAQTDETKMDYIHNKPELTVVTVDGNVVEIFDADTKLDKITSTGRVRLYSVDASGNQSSRSVGTSTLTIASESIPQYWKKTSNDGSPDNEPSGKGVLISSTPTRDFHVATKKYVDNKTIISSDEPTDAGVGTLWLDTSEVVIAYEEGVGF